MVSPELRSRLTAPSLVTFQGAPGCCAAKQLPNGMLTYHGYDAASQAAWTVNRKSDLAHLSSVYYEYNGDSLPTWQYRRGEFSVDHQYVYSCKCQVPGRRFGHGGIDGVGVNRVWGRARHFGFALPRCPEARYAANPNSAAIRSAGDPTVPPA